MSQIHFSVNALRRRMSNMSTGDEESAHLFPLSKITVMYSTLAAHKCRASASQLLALFTNECKSHEIIEDYTMNKSHETPSFASAYERT